MTQYYTSKYGCQKPFEVILKEYYKNRVDYINNNLLAKVNIDIIWD